MTIDCTALLQRLRLPLMCAPMSIASTPTLAEACCRAGIIGCFPTHNAWKDSGLEDWLQKITTSLAKAADTTGVAPAPLAVNVSVSRLKPAELLHRELDACRQHGVEIITTNVGDPAPVVQRAHDWGAIVIHDVTTLQQAERAVGSGVDGLMLVCAGAGGLGGALSPMAFVPRVRGIFDGLIQLAGGISTGAGIRAAQILGADMVCCGTRFIATRESGVDGGHKEMLVDADLGDVVWTDRVSGIAGNFLRPSLSAHGLDPDDLPELDATTGKSALPRHITPWDKIWSAGHSVAGITSIPTVADLVASMEREFLATDEGAMGISTHLVHSNGRTPSR